MANRTLYHRNYISEAFVVKKIFSDEGGEALAFIYADDGDTIDSIHEKIYRIVSSCRSDKKDASSDAMDMFLKMPRFLGKAIVSFICWLDRHGWVPQSLIDSDPYYSSVVLTNLGSIKLHSGYHHLTNWGTNSLFVVVGERRKRPFYDDRGNEIVIDESRDDSQFLQPVDEETRAALEKHVDGFSDAYLKLSASTGDPVTPYGELLNYIEEGSELDKTLKQVFLIGDWSHNSYYQYGGSSLISAYSIGGGCYVVDYSASATVNQPVGTIDLTRTFRSVIDASGDRMVTATIDDI